MSTLLCVLYPDPQAGYPPVYARDEIPDIGSNVNGRPDPAPEGPLGFLPEAEVVISQPFWPAYLTKERLAKASKLKLAAHHAVQRNDARYAAGTLDILQCYFEGRPICEEYLVIDAGILAGVGAQSYEMK
ncbi:hypothetical protein ACIG53_06380 [Streptomyces bauhiniae]|uniref:hypothetical protein n=1 Tax=Streptomyces bauhiniae TaxID=2340725 RepID=UPI0037CE1026